MFPCSVSGKTEDAAALNLDGSRLSADLGWYADRGVAGFIDDEWRQRFGNEDILLYGKILNECLK